MKTNQTHNSGSSFKWLAIVSAVAVFAACGGGGGGSSSQITISGVAATGAALSGATVSVTCATGTGSATSNTDGSYSVTIVNGKGPCVLTATKGTTVLRSVAPSAGVYNITALTDMLTNYLATRAGTTPENLLSNTNGKAILADTTAVTDGQTAVAALVKTTYNVTLSTTSFLTTTIVTPQGGTQSASDKDLENLKTANVVGSDGKPTTSAANSVTTEAQKAPPYVATTGGTSS